MKDIVGVIILFLTTVTSASFAEIKPENQKFKLTSKPSLTFDIAHRMAMACIERQSKNNSSPVYVSIYDEGANPILFLKMDGAVLGAGVAAMRKAETSARLPFSSAEVGNWVKDNASVAHVPGLIGVRGGLPIMSKNGAHLGGIGVSGGAAEEDEKCAQTAIDTVKDNLDM